MSETQTDLTLLGLIIVSNIFITVLFRKYKRFKKTEKKTFDLGNAKAAISNFVQVQKQIFKENHYPS